jgi:hypothetical protein
MRRITDASNKEHEQQALLDATGGLAPKARNGRLDAGDVI